MRLLLCAVLLLHGPSLSEAELCAAYENHEPDTVSSASCGQLGWDTALGSDDDVCGESDDGLGGCSGLLTWSCANRFCEIAGARLCTLVELLSDESAGTGCAYDSKKIWSSSNCSNSGMNR